MTTAPIIEIGDLVGLDMTLEQRTFISLPIVKGKRVLREEMQVGLNSTGQVTGIVLDIFPVAHEYKIGKTQSGYHYSSGYHLLIGLPEPKIVYFEDGWTHLAIIRLIAKGDGQIIYDPTDINNNSQT